MREVLRELKETFSFKELSQNFWKVLGLLGTIISGVILLKWATGWFAKAANPERRNG